MPLNNFTFSSIKRFFQAWVIILSCQFLLSCASAPEEKKPATTETAATIAPEKQESTQQITPEYYITLAQATDTQHSIDWLLQASVLYQQQENPLKALWLAKQTTDLISALHIDNPGAFNFQQYQLHILMAQSLIALEDERRAQDQLVNAFTLTEATQLPLTQQYYLLSADIYQAKGQEVQQLNAQLHAFALNTSAQASDVIYLWQQLSQLTTWQIQQLAKLSPPNFTPWQALLEDSHRYGSQPALLQQLLPQWQQKYPSHPAQIVVHQLLEQNPASLPIVENIAVILPLSGKQQRAGLALQQGILAAFEAKPSKALHFYDSTTLDYATLSSTLTEQKIDFIIGPLLKSQVNAFLQLEEIYTPTLLLNVPTDIQLKPHQFALSMRPEEEAIQAASLLAGEQFQHPVILTHNDSVSRRIAKAFARTWQKEQGYIPEIVHFKSGSKMQTEVKASLDVNLSQARIKELRSRLDATIKYEARNRRDIDMIYLVASSQATQLVKPYIDVNTSPFADVIPIYASSRSHSINNLGGDYSDLNHLMFTEIPWLLPNSMQDQALSKQAQQLWPKRPITLRRIYAMGIDSFNLIDEIPGLVKAPFARHYGQTGILRLNKDNIFTRTLVWGQYRNQKVVQLAME